MTGFVVGSIAGVAIIVLVALAPRGFRPTEEGGQTGRGEPKKERMATGRRARTLRPLRGERQAGTLPAGATVTFAAERRLAGIDEVLASLDRDLVGLVPVKKKVQEVAALLLVDRARQRFGLEAPRPNLHMCFTGPPRTGKTTVALRMADLLHRLGYLEQGQVVHAMRDDLVGEYIGQTAPKTKRILDRAMGGVLFIDEAYYLYRDTDSRDYGQEVIDILLQVMENDSDKLVVILAGYKDRMDTFFTSNPGHEFAHRSPSRFRRLPGGGTGRDRPPDAGAGQLSPVCRGRGRVPRLSHRPDGATSVRQRAQRPQRARKRPPPACPPPRLRPGAQLDP
jgi:ATPase family associated with various cellular activities (AAA)